MRPAGWAPVRIVVRRPFVSGPSFGQAAGLQKSASLGPDMGADLLRAAKLVAASSEPPVERLIRRPDRRQAQGWGRPVSRWLANWLAGCWAGGARPNACKAAPIWAAPVFRANLDLDADSQIPTQTPMPRDSHQDPKPEPDSVGSDDKTHRYQRPR